MDGSVHPRGVNTERAGTHAFELRRSVCLSPGFVLELEMFPAVVTWQLTLSPPCNLTGVARRLRLIGSAVGVCVLTQLFGCTPGASTPDAKGPTAAYREEHVDRVLVMPNESLTAFELLQRGKMEFERGNMDSASRDLDLVVEHDPRGPWVEEALYWSAKAHEGRLDFEASAARFERVGLEFATGKLARDALLRAIRLHVYLERWSRAGQLSHHFTEQYPERAPREEVVVQSALSLRELAANGDSVEGRERAQLPLARARSVIEKYRLDSAGHIPRDLAQVYFAKGELLRLEGEAVTFVPLPPDFADRFEQRAQLLLDAQSAYSDVMRAYDAHWTAMAGFRVGELYKRLHEDVMRAPRPSALDTERKRAIFEAALRLRYSILLKKGLNLMEHTLAMAERTSEDSQWVARARQARDELRAAVETEQAAVDNCPYSREDMERVLAALAQKTQRDDRPTSR